MLWQIRIIITITVMMSAWSLAFAQAPDRDLRPRTASFSGCVTVEGKPSANVTIAATEHPPGIREARIFSLGGREFVDPYFYKTTTDSEGRYQISGLPAGTYQISPLAPAHVPESNLLGLDASVRVTLDEGEVRERVDFALSRGGVVTGRVTDEDGRPQVGRYVGLIELIDQNQRPEVSGISERALETDDRGVFRIFGLRKGRYIARAGGENDTLRGAISGKKTQVTYHPDVVNQEEATVIEVAEGKEITGVDIRLRNPKETFAASGRVINSVTGTPLAQTGVFCFRVERQEEEIGNHAADSITDTEGNFTLTGLKPGKYKAKLSRPPEGDSEYYSEGTYFEVSDGDVSGVEVLARRGAIISGEVLVEEGRDASVQARLSQLSLELVVYKEHFVGAIRDGSAVDWLRSQIGNDGAFRLTGAHPGKAMIRIAGDSTNSFYLLRVERDGVDVTNGFEIGPGEEVKGIRVVIGQGNGRILGSLKVIGGTLPEGVNLFVQVEREGSPRIGRAGEVDEKGRFVIKGLLTGEYSLFIFWGTKNHRRLDRNLTIPQPPKQRISVTNGAETQVSLTVDLSRREQEKQ
jgi:hypothetical protein